MHKARSFQLNPDDGNITDVNINNDELSLINSLTNRFMLEICSVPRKLYCPFCLFDFTFDFLLRNHIQNEHLNEIKNFSQINLELFTFDQCLYCHAKFYTKNILPKHVVRKHSEQIIHYVSELKLDDFIYCKFCTYKISQNQSKLLFIHLENKHLQLLERFLIDISCEFNKLKQHDVKDPSLDSCIKKLTLSSNDSKFTNVLRERETPIKSILKRSESASNFRVRRRLQFDLHNMSPTLSVASDKENCEPFKRNERFTKSFGFSRNNIFRQSKLLGRTCNKVKPDNFQQPLMNSSIPINESMNINVENNSDILQKLPFRCGLCTERFTNNNMLVYHVKQTHHGFRLKARYRCGECKAKFYRNNYLVQHYYRAHKD